MVFLPSSLLVSSYSKIRKNRRVTPPLRAVSSIKSARSAARSRTFWHVSFCRSSIIWSVYFCVSARLVTTFIWTVVGIILRAAAKAEMIRSRSEADRSSRFTGVNSIILIYRLSLVTTIPSLTSRTGENICVDLICNFFCFPDFFEEEAAGCPSTCGLCLLFLNIDYPPWA